MIAGHAPLAFAAVASVAVLRGVDRRRAVLLGAVAGGFAVVPDVDMAYAVLGVLGSSPSGVWSATEAFWSSSKAVHRAMTHSLVLAVPSAAAFALVAANRRRTGGALLAALVVAGAATGGALGGAMMALYAGAGAAVALAARSAGVGARGTLLAALGGLLTHPFGDFFTGEPPALLYPLDAGLTVERIALHPDPTLNLLGVFGLELASIWLGVLVAARLTRWGLRERLDARASLGAVYGAAALVLPPPTLDVSYHFVFSVLAVGAVGAGPVGRIHRRDLARGAVTGLAGVTVGWLTYALVYLSPLV